jgi:hypothetical protein
MANFKLISNWGFLSLYLAPIKSYILKTRFLGTLFSEISILIGARYKDKSPNYKSA